MDDESLGCGGLLAKYPDECTVLTIAAGDETRRSEHRKAMETLRVKNYENLGFKDGDVAASAVALVDALDRKFAELMPHEVYLPYPSLHQDHISVYEAGLRACRISMSVDHWFPPVVMVYDIQVYDVNLYAHELRWNVYESLTEEQAELKAAACKAYSSEIPGESHPMNFVKELSAAAGSVRRLPFAEQYSLVRQIRS